MVEASLVNLAELVVLTVGVVIALLQLRDIKETRETELETRQAQLFMTIFVTLHSEASFRQYVNTMYHMEWKDFDDWWNKYGPINNPEAYARFNSILWTYGEIGILVFDGLLDIIQVGKLVGEVPLKLYQKFEPILHELRTRIESNVSYMPFEYLATRLAAAWEGKPVVSVIEHLQRDIQRYKESTDLSRAQTSNRT